jgi:hypothetical protein
LHRNTYSSPRSFTARHAVPLQQPRAHLCGGCRSARTPPLLPGHVHSRSACLHCSQIAAEEDAGGVASTASPCWVRPRCRHARDRPRRCGKAEARSGCTTTVSVRRSSGAHDRRRSAGAEVRFAPVPLPSPTYTSCGPRANTSQACWKRSTRVFPAM